MLSFIYRLVNDFQREHRFRPNVLYINPIHLDRLHSDFANQKDLVEISRLLDMEILLSPDAVHPHVAWSQAASRAAG